MSTTEAEAIATLAARAEIKPLDDGEVDSLALLPPGWRAERIDTESYLEIPRRSRGTSYVHDAPSFIEATKRRTVANTVEPVIYADESENQLVAILNDDRGAFPGWRDYRVQLQLRRTPEWMLWLSRDGQLMGQQSFAEHIEEGVNELRDPPPALMLDLAQSFQATVGADFKGGTRLQSGAVQFRYEEKLDAKAGSAGEIQIPERLTIVVAPFFGSARYEVTALFRFRLNREQFTLGYKLDRRHEVERAAFSDIKAHVAEGLPDHAIVAGPAPEITNGKAYA